ncbi:Nuclear envelope morphology protein 1 [Exophiala dermatitidis]|uniref:Nuclear envelope morphology protein 1 n=1 Tax=Exophiala dermatitidis TaxID=5970 RepID=A0AAN6EZX0_EXODE|nr:Nuclear envelope morphology protein 1 [Exophiala dermatitidis]KAJ4523998.1 Nuclear envelope morphology protein 1 [Exophiala dermatitidis]KAJ4525732.1 Nuclear envelope morphology protein 1 [Exophiala dermatitidis]KAJ4537058.1 Nuclear envelope morphology protein 1 [Exophiala dermatitidis]KAJ4555344.1 Nuclear envelope morphology protein 1 [Exophiala dermatitidis]
MNSLNLISSRVIGQTQHALRPRSRSQVELSKKEYGEDGLRGRSYSDDHAQQLQKEADGLFPDQLTPESASEDGEQPIIDDGDDEDQPLLSVDEKNTRDPEIEGWRGFLKRLADAISAILAAIGAPVVYVAKYFRDQEGKLSVVPRWARRDRVSHRTGGAVARPDAAHDGRLTTGKSTHRVLQETKLRRSYSSESQNNALTSESESDLRKLEQPHLRTKSKAGKGLKEGPETRRSSIRIKEQNDLALKRRKQKKNSSPLSDTTPLTVDDIKSPTSPSTSLKFTRYPHAPQPPRPLIPRRQPSYANISPRSPTRGGPPLQQKTLVLDLDETLIHSLAKGGRMSSGHMVEVKLNTPVALSAQQPGQAPPILGPHHPILYYVHKRPHCDEFLRKVSKWYKLVIFTASVQEYADPVIDWLEQERKYFVGRYYRQHCTFRNGAYIKDLSTVEPDLSKVIILDNSPVSYIFHEDNAIPIEGWINDPTDNDLLHLIPMLEALQYVTDVRALLALRRGEAEAAP